MNERFTDNLQELLTQGKKICTHVDTEQERQMIQNCNTLISHSIAPLFYDEKKNPRKEPRTLQ